MFIPMFLQAVLLSANAYLWMKLGWAAIPYINFDMNNLPTAISAFIQSGGFIGNVLLVLANLVLATIIWFPFFKAADKFEVEKEKKLAAERQQKLNETNTVSE